MAATIKFYNILQHNMQESFHMCVAKYHVFTFTARLDDFRRLQKSFQAHCPFFSSRGKQTSLSLLYVQKCLEIILHKQCTEDDKFEPALGRWRAAWSKQSCARQNTMNTWTLIDISEAPTNQIGAFIRHWHASLITTCHCDVTLIANWFWH